jgi:hypothetical protein
VAAATYFADIEKQNFSLMHCWNILKDEPKWIELKRRMDEKPQSSSAGDAATQDSNSSMMPIDLEVSPPSSSTRKHPMGRDAAKAERKKAKYRMIMQPRCINCPLKRFRCLKRVRLNGRFDSVRWLI